MRRNQKLLLVAALLLLLAGLGNRTYFKRQHQMLHLDARIETAQATPTVNLLLGGFRGVVADWLWIRVMLLQEQGRFVEILQLAEWITGLQPQFPDIWILHAWNITYNITVLLPDGLERWHWVRHGYEILRDQAIPATGFHPRICAEIAWILMHKIGGTTDDFADTLFLQWMRGIEPLLEPDGRLPADAKRRISALAHIGMSEAMMADFEANFGSHDWRHPLTHAAAWAYTGFTLHPGTEGTSLAERLFLSTYRQLFLQGTITNDDGDIILRPDLARLEGVRKAFAAASSRTMQPSFRETHLMTLELIARILLAHGQYESARDTFNEITRRFPQSEIALRGFAALTANAQLPQPRRIETYGAHR
ncbi:MAG: hypothetical protein ACNA71_05990 [Kiritimatiellia bacterium]